MILSTNLEEIRMQEAQALEKYISIKRVREEIEKRLLDRVVVPNNKSPKIGEKGFLDSIVK